MSQKKLYVGNIAFTSIPSDLQTVFEAYGTVETLEIATDRETGRSRGFGFIEMASESEAKAAIEGLDGQELNGRQLTVNIAKPRLNTGGAPRTSYDRGGSSSGGGGGRRW